MADPQDAAREALQVTNTTSSPLLRLPPELRNIIYDLLLPFDSILLNNGSRHSLPNEHGVPTTAFEPPKLLQVCRQIREEALPSVYRSCQFHYSDLAAMYDGGKVYDINIDRGTIVLELDGSDMKATLTLTGFDNCPCRERVELDAMADAKGFALAVDEHSGGKMERSAMDDVLVIKNRRQQQQMQYRPLAGNHHTTTYTHDLLSAPTRRIPPTYSLLSR
ncbi:hypothetical protein LTR85_009014 [Meristemomyces frigidus]|nr:hypothetical protein LTR85_009014 [Meristemomyces frigidus]